MTPLIFAPTPLPHDIAGWLTIGWLLVIWLVLEHREEPRSVMLFAIFGFIVGLFVNGRDSGGVAGSCVGTVLGLASARLSLKGTNTRK